MTGRASTDAWYVNWLKDERIEDAMSRHGQTLPLHPLVGRGNVGYRCACMARLGDGERYYTLDALRGVAAIIVMFGHNKSLLMPIPGPQLWLAVDLFFILSGFVLGKVYEPRFSNGMTTLRFMKHRYIRLYPLWMLGLSIGIISAAATLALGKGSLTLPQLTAATIAGILLLPTPLPYGDGAIFPLDPPGWSLFFEIFANLLFVLTWKRLTTRVLLAIVLCCLSILFIQANFGIENEGATWSRFWGGFPRVGFSFFLGVIIQRLHKAAPSKSGYAWAIPLGMIPLFYGAHTALTNLFIVAFAFPLLVLTAAKFEPMSTTLFASLGAASYAIYALHFPISTVVQRAAIFLGHRPEEFSPEIGILCCISIIPIAIVADRWYDQPTRAYLTHAAFFGKLRLRLAARQKREVIGQ